MTLNGSRTFAASFSPSKIDYVNTANVAGLYGTWTQEYTLQLGQQLLLEIVEWTRPGSLGSGQPKIMTNIYDVPAESTSEARGGPLNCTTCGEHWTWDADRVQSRFVEAQTIQYHSNPSSYLASITFNLYQRPGKWNKTIVATSDWSNVDQKGFNAGKEMVRVSWGTSDAYFEMNSESDPTQLESMFLSNLLQGTCRWSYVKSRFFYNWNVFETNGDVWQGAGVFLQ